MSHAIADPTKLNVVAVYGTHLTIKTQIEVTIRTLLATDVIVDISVSKLSVGNNFMALISYEDKTP